MYLNLKQILTKIGSYHKSYHKLSYLTSPKTYIQILKQQFYFYLYLTS
jgi:hypothetical protein